VQLLVFTRFHMEGAVQATDRDRTSYNDFAARQVDDFRDFINLHYVTERRDTPFWNAVADDYVTATTRERLKLWQQKMPSYSDFTPLPGAFAHTEQQLFYPVLDGLGLLNRNAAQSYMAEHPQEKSKAGQAARSLTAEYRAAAPKAMSHRQFLNSL
jgi:hypothetical protein